MTVHMLYASNSRHEESCSCFAFSSKKLRTKAAMNYILEKQKLFRNYYIDENDTHGILSFEQEINKYNSGNSSFEELLCEWNDFASYCSSNLEDCYRFSLFDINKVDSDLSELL